MENNQENRRAYREMLFSTPGLGEFISGAITFEETLFDVSRDGTTKLVDILPKRAPPPPPPLPSLNVALTAFSIELLRTPFMSVPSPPHGEHVPADAQRFGRVPLVNLRHLSPPAQGIIPGIKVDKGVQALFGTDGETVTQGIDDLGKR